MRGTSQGCPRIRRRGAALATTLAIPILASIPAAPAAAEEAYEVRWSATIEAALKQIADREADDDVGGFFDRYEYTPNKSSALPVELGLTDAALDVLGESDTPRLQIRLESPTSNLGVSGDDVDRPFLNQRADVFGRADGIELDLAYRRIRTERLRIFPNPGASGQAFFDLTAPDDRYDRERTGFRGELRLRPAELREGQQELSWLGLQLSLRGGHQAREGERQVRFSLPAANQWIGRTRDEDQSTARVGGGVLVAPGGLFTLALDVDHERFREDAAAPTDSDLGVPFPSGDRSIGFVPDTDRTTGRIRLHGRLGDRAVLVGSAQISRLEQVGRRTPSQRANGLRDNEVLYASANFVANLAIAGPFSAKAFFEFDQRDNDLDRSTSLFGDDGGSQVDPFLDRWRRILYGGEILYRPRASNLLALGLRARRIDRDLDFVPPDPGGFVRRISPENAQISDESESYTVYARAVLRPLRAVGIRGEIGYREAPRTAYTLDLDDYVYGRVRASYRVPMKKPLMLTAFLSGSSGESRDAFFVGGLGPDPAGETVDQDFQRWSYRWGITAVTSPWRGTSLYTSLFHSRGSQEFDLVVSSLPRYFQDLVPLSFVEQGPIEYDSEEVSWVLGGRTALGERNELGASYVFTHAEARYDPAGALDGAALRDARRVETDVHRVTLDWTRRLREGLQASIGYRLDVLDDRSPVRGAVGSVAPFDLDTFQHTLLLGLTLTSALGD